VLQHSLHSGNSNSNTSMIHSVPQQHQHQYHWQIDSPSMLSAPLHSMMSSQVISYSDTGGGGASDVASTTSSTSHHRHRHHSASFHRKASHSDSGLAMVTGLGVHHHHTGGPLYPALSRDASRGTSFSTSSLDVSAGRPSPSANRTFGVMNSAPTAAAIQQQQQQQQPVMRIIRQPALHDDVLKYGISLRQSFLGLHRTFCCRRLMRGYLRGTQDFSTVEIMTSRVVQKSYKNEKRWLTPPPLVCCLVVFIARRCVKNLMQRRSVSLDPCGPAETSSSASWSMSVRFKALITVICLLTLSSR